MASPRRSRLIRITVWAAVLGLVLGVLSSLALAAGAEAHAALRSITPADGARLTRAPTAVVLTFDEPIGKTFATVTVTDGAGASVGVGRAVVNGAVVSQRLGAGLTSGTYSVAFRVVSDDGHPVSDRTTFTLALPADGVGAATTAPDPTMTPLGSASGSPTTSSPASPASSAVAGAAPPSGEDDQALRVGLAVGVAGLALAAGTALVAFTRRGRAS
jgi:methionine-rich copper-binding protein CopC